MKEIDKYIACFILGAIGDTIGFKNGDWEFNYNFDTDYYFTNQIIFEFINLGGINKLDIKKWNVSDDTLLHMATGKALLNDNLNTENYINEYIKTLKDKKKRFFGKRTIKSLEILKKNKKAKIKYDIYGGGSGAAMRSMCIGLAYHGKENRHKLIKIAIDTGIITHNNPIGYLGSVASALFVSYAIEGVDIFKWPFKLVKWLEHDIIDSHVKTLENNTKQYYKDKEKFIDKWKRYLEHNFNNGEYIIHPFLIDPAERSKYYYENFSTFKNKIYPGSGGDDSVIIAYDSLVYSHLSHDKEPQENWEKLVVYSMLHVGDSDTTGSIAASLYGCMYGFSGVPDHYLKDVEFNEELIKIGKKIYEKYGD